jgi:hypothetical protein
MRDARPSLSDLVEEIDTSLLRLSTISFMADALVRENPRAGNAFAQVAMDVETDLIRIRDHLEVMS